MIRAEEWLASRDPQPPPALAERLVQVADGRTFEDSLALSRFFIVTAASLLGGLSDDRSGAVDLLVVDSLVTYAIEAAAEDCSSLDAFAAEAMQRLSGVPGGGGAS